MQTLIEKQQKYVLGQLRDANLRLAKVLDGDCIFIHSPITPPLDETLRKSLEDIKQKQVNDKEHLIVLLQTNGGYIELVERLVEVMRNHYRKVSFIVPGFAYSAGTVMVLSGDRIFMNYYSILGPIDPQFESLEGWYLPGQGKIWGVNELIKKINSADSLDDVKAELLLLRTEYNSAEIFRIVQSIELGITLIKKWLPLYKFKDWKYTETRGKKVTPRMKSIRARKIARKLGDAEFWHSHNRGISMERLQRKDIDLKIDNYGENSELKDVIDDYYEAMTYFMGVLRVGSFVHSEHKLWSI